MIQRQRTDPSAPISKGALRLVAVVLAVALVLVVVWVTATRLVGPGGDALAPECQADRAAPSPTVAPTAVTYDAVFTGDPTGATDVTSELQAFLEGHDGQHVALAQDGVYQVTSVRFTATSLTVDFRGSRLEASVPDVHGILRVQDLSAIVLNDPYVVGTGYAWEATLGDPADNQDALQQQHGIQVDGGSQITIDRPITRDTRGDGIYIGYQAGVNEPAVGVVINDPDVERASRNGISPVAGQVTVVGGRIARAGLFGIDFEPNNDVGANSIDGVIRGVDIRQVTDLPATASHASAPYAIAAAGYSTATKRGLRIEQVTGEDLRMTVRDTEVVVICSNVSDTATTADFPGVGSLVFSGNVGITKQ